MHAYNMCAYIKSTFKRLKTGFLALHYLLAFAQLMSIESMISFNRLILSHPPLLLPSIFPSITVFSTVSALHFRWPKHWNFSFSISPSNEYSGLISFKIDWFDHLTAQEILKSLPQYHIQKYQFFGAQLSLWSNSHIHT